MRTEFRLNEKEAEKADAFIKRQLQKSNHYTGAIGGRFQVTFVMTSIGCAIKVRDSDFNEEEDVTDYDSW